MRKPFATTGMLFIGLIAILGAIGIVNGLWSKNLVINGSVTTGDLNADWDCGYVNDDGAVGTIAGGGACTLVEPAGDTGADPKGGLANPDPRYVIPPNFVASTGPEKDVARCQLTLGSSATAPDFQFGTVTISNGYPSYECGIVLALSNTGSIPFNISGIFTSLCSVTPVPAGGCPLASDNGTGIELGHAGAGGVWTPDCDFGATGVGVQVDPGTEKTITCIVHVKETAFQSVCTGTTTTSSGGIVTVAQTCTSPVQTYNFALNACVAQWNEAATYAQCKASPQHEGPIESVPGAPAPKTGPNPPTT